MIKKAEKIYKRILKTNDKKKIEKLLLDLWRIAVFMREGDRCVICGKPAVDVHHIVRKSQSKNLKYDVLNGVPLCKGCHIFGIHAGDIEKNKKLMEHIGDKRFVYLMHNKHKLFKNTKANLRDRAEELFEECKNVQF